MSGPRGEHVESLSAPKLETIEVILERPPSIRKAKGTSVAATAQPQRDSEAEREGGGGAERHTDRESERERELGTGKRAQAAGGGAEDESGMRSAGARRVVSSRVAASACLRRRVGFAARQRVPFATCNRSFVSNDTVSGGGGSWLAAVSALSPTSVLAPQPDLRSVKQRAAADVGEELQRRNAAALEAVHPWFVQNMSEAYFHTVAPATQTKHLESLAYMYSMSREPDIYYHEDDELTLIKPGEGTGLARQWAGGEPTNHLDAAKHTGRQNIAEHEQVHVAGRDDHDRQRHLQRGGDVQRIA